VSPADKKNSGKTPFSVYTKTGLSSEEVAKNSLLAAYGSFMNPIGWD